MTSLGKPIFSWAAEMPPSKKTLAEFYSLISLLIKPSLLRCENDSRLVINCWRSHHFKKDLAPKGAGVVQAQQLSFSVGQWLFKCFSYHKNKKGLSGYRKKRWSTKYSDLLNHHTSLFWGVGRRRISMGENDSILSLCIIMQRQLKGSWKDQRRQKSLSGSFVMLKKGSGIRWSNNNAANNNKMLLEWQTSLALTLERTESCVDPTSSVLLFHTFSFYPQTSKG